MEQNFFFITVFFLFISCKQTAENSKEPLSGDLIHNPATISGIEENKKIAELTFENLSHDFGKLTEGSKGEYDFKFKNTGNVPLLISDVQATCGCTTPYWPKRLIFPDSSEKIRVVYDSKNRVGQFSKDIVVTANTYPNTTTLTISGVVFEK